MTMRVNGPGGVIVNFPDGTDPATINGVMQDAVNQNSAKQRVTAEGEGLGIDNAVRSVARGVPLIGGAMDEASAGLNTGFGYLGDYGKELAYQRERDKQYDQQHPYLSGAGQLAGGVLGTIAGARAIAPSVSVPATMPSKIATGTGLGAAIGGEEGFTRGEGGASERVKAAVPGTAVGGAVGFLAPPLAAGIGRMLPGRAASMAPTIKEIGAQKNQAYDAAKQSGLVIRSESYNQFADRMVKEAADDAIDTDLQPKASVLLKRLQEAKDKQLSLTELDNLRKKAVRITQSGQKDEGHFAGKIIEGIDDYLDNLSPNDVLSGDPQAAAQQINQARTLARRQGNSEVIDKAMRKAQNAVAANYTQAGMRTALAQKFRAIVDNDKVFRRFSPEEQQAIRDVVNVSVGQRTLDILGKVGPQNSFALLGALYNPAVGVPGMAVGHAARMGAAAITTGKARLADEMVRSGRNLPAPPASTRTERMARALLTTQGAREAANRLPQYLSLAPYDER